MAMTPGIIQALSALRASGCDADADRIESALAKADSVALIESKWFGPDNDGEMYVQTGDRWWKAKPIAVGAAGRFPSDAAAEEFIDRHKHLIGGAEND